MCLGWSNANLSCLRFGGGFEMMKAGGDVDGIWTLFGSGMWYVPWHASVIYMSCNYLQHLRRCGTNPIRSAATHCNYEKEDSACAFPRILQRTSPQAVTDGRKQKGFVLSLGKLPHPRSRRLYLTECDYRAARNSLKVSAHLLPWLRRRGN